MLHWYSNELSCNTEDNWTPNSLSEETNPKNKEYYRPNKQKNTTDTANRKEIPMWNRFCVDPTNGCQLRCLLNWTISMC